MEYTVWLLISISSLSVGEYEIERYKSAAVCVSYMESINEHAPKLHPVCVHNNEPWRRITPSGPNAPELWARDRESKGLPTFNDPFKPKAP